MDETSTTDAPVDDSGARALPEPTDSAPAEQSEDQAPTEALPTDTPQDDVTKFGKGQGFTDEELQNPAVQKALRVAKGNKTQAQELTTSKKELEAKLNAIGEKAPEGPKQEFEDPLQQEMAELKGQMAQESWKVQVGYFLSQNPEASALIDDMDKIAEEKPHLARDLDTLLEVAKARSADPEVISAQAKIEEREKLAKASQAAPVNRNASAPDVGDNRMSYDLIQEKGGDRAWFKKNEKAINTFLKSQLK